MYEMRECAIEGASPFMLAYTSDGAYIGNEGWAIKLEERGIQPQLVSPEHSVCSIGFCEREQKWYGWSHRAIFGFGVGDSVKRGDCAFTAASVDDLIEDFVSFHDNDPEARARIAPDYENNRVWIGEKHYPATMVNSADGVVLAIEHPEMMPEGTITMGGYWQHAGRGEWTAATLDDAKQMACDFADGVS